MDDYSYGSAREKNTEAVGQNEQVCICLTPPSRRAHPASGPGVNPGQVPADITDQTGVGFGMYSSPAPRSITDDSDVMPAEISRMQFDPKTADLGNP